MSAYELEREVNIARNRARLVELGLDGDRRATQGCSNSALSQGCEGKG
jgi:hypothetical protein